MLYPERRVAHETSSEPAAQGSRHQASHLDVQRPLTQDQAIAILRFLNEVQAVVNRLIGEGYTVKDGLLIPPNGTQPKDKQSI
jgi:hypothetical protein